MSAVAAPVQGSARLCKISLLAWLQELDNEDLARHERGMKSAMESLQASRCGTAYLVRRFYRHTEEFPF